MLKKIIALLLFLISSNLYSQDIRIGEWRSHLAYNDVLKVAEKGDSIFCATRGGLFVYDRANSELKGLSKVDGFSEISTKTIRYNEKYNMLFIGYQSSNIDILAGNKIINVPDVFRKGDIIGVKEITDFNFYKQFCYISTTFGIVKYNIEKNEITEDYRELGPNGTQLAVNDIAFYKDSIYAATPIGILSASLSNAVNLRDSRSWKIIKTDSCFALDTFNNKLWAGLSKSGNAKFLNYNANSWQPVIIQNIKPVISIENKDNKLVIVSDDGINVLNSSGGQRFVPYGGIRHAIITEDNYLWAAHFLYGLLKFDANNQISFLLPNGPYRNEVSSIFNYKDEIWVASGGATPIWGTLYYNSGFYRFKNNTWTNYNGLTVANYPGFQSVLSIVADPVTGHKWVASFVNGLMEFDNDNVIKLYNGFDTKALQQPTFDTSRRHIKLIGLSYDKDNNLWMTNFAVPRPLVVRKNNGKFYSFDVGSSDGANYLSYVVADDYNQVWAVRPDDGLIVYNHNGTIEDEKDDKKRVFTTGEGIGNLPSNDVLTLTKDLAGQIWIGTTNGLAVVYDPSLAFSKNNSDAQQIWINNGKQSGYLLSGESVSAIAIDGGNRKWIGTKKGLWVTDSAGTKILWNFTTKNSPLISDNILSLGINGESGEVFIGTDKGLVSYRTNATVGNDSFSNVYAFPNPVKPDYEGLIAIKGLARSSSVKITDITGNLVYETTSEGGTATWNGRNFSGEKANSGVYLVFCANSDGSNAIVTKIMIIR